MLAVAGTEVTGAGMPPSPLLRDAGTAAGGLLVAAVGWRLLPLERAAAALLPELLALLAPAPVRRALAPDVP